jgi:hypothetical protein
MRNLRKRKNEKVVEESEEGEKLSAYLSNESKLMEGLDHSQKVLHFDYVKDGRFRGRNVTRGLPVGQPAGPVAEEGVLLQRGGGVVRDRDGAPGEGGRHRQLGG